jgi:hypothetical protein
MPTDINRRVPNATCERHCRAIYTFERPASSIEIKREAHLLIKLFWHQVKFWPSVDHERHFAAGHITFETASGHREQRGCMQRDGQSVSFQNLLNIVICTIGELESWFCCSSFLVFFNTLHSPMGSVQIHMDHMDSVQIHVDPHRIHVTLCGSTRILSNSELAEISSWHKGFIPNPGLNPQPQRPFLKPGSN